MAEKKALLESLDAKYKIPPIEVERLLTQMIKEGTVYSPREGYLKKT